MAAEVSTTKKQQERLPALVDPPWPEQQALLAGATEGAAECEGGCRVHFWDCSCNDTDPTAAPRVLCLEGMGSTHHGWLAFATHAARRGWRLLLVDNRGMGRSVGGVGVRGVPYTVRLLARDALAVLHAAGWVAPDAPRVHVVGVSMGGMIAQELVAMAPQLFASVSFVSTRAGGWRWTRLPSWGTCACLLRSPFVRSDARAEAENSVKMVYPKRFLAEHLSDLVDMMMFGRSVTGLPPVETANAQASACMAHDGWKTLAVIRGAGVPAQVFTGSEDPMIDPDFSRAMAAELRCPLHEAKGAGHLLFIERPEWFRQKMFEFVESNRAATQPPPQAQS